MKTTFLFEWEWQKLPEGIIPAELNEYLETVWNSQHLFFEENLKETTEENISDLKKFKQGFFRFDGNAIGAKNYVGFLQFNGTAITILPKIFKHHVPSAHIVELITSNLLHWLRFSTRIKFPFTEVNFDEQSFDDFLEPFIYIFSEYTNRLIELLPFQRFEEITESTQFLKGQLAINDYINHSLATGNFQKIISTYDTCCFDNKLNRIIKFVSSLLLTVTSNRYSIQNLRNILFILEDVKKEVFSSNECSTIPINAAYSDWNVVLNMCQMFLSNQGFKSQQPNKPNFCFLVPMELVFEEYIAGVLEKYGTGGLVMQGVGQKRYLTRDEKFRLKPDIIYSSDMILDTKYKMLFGLESTFKTNINSTDLYQMLAYAIRYKINRIALIFPFVVQGSSAKLINIEKSFFVDEEFSKSTVQIFIVLAGFGTFEKSLHHHDETLAKEFELFKKIIDK